MGVWILMPWDAFTGRPAWAWIAEVAPEEFWGVLFLSVALFKLFSVIANHPGWTRTSSFVTFLLWLLIAVSWFYSDWQAPAVWIAVYLAVQAGHHYITAKK